MELYTADIIGIAVCLLFSGFFSGSETVLTSLSDFKVEQLVEKHPTAGRGLHMWARNHTAILTTILIGNNLFNITASALATDLAGQLFPGSGIPIAVGAMTALLLFSGEITPKALARSYAEPLALPVINVVLVFHVLFFPATWLLSQFVRLLVHTLGGRLARDGRVTEEDIEYIVSLGRRQGVLDKDKEHLLSSIFTFSETITREIMVPRTDMIAIPVDAAYDKVVELTLETGYSRIPVYEGSLDHILGIFYIKHLITPPQPEEKEAFLANRMGPAVFVPETKRIAEVLKLFQKERIHMAIVVNEFGGTEGIVTMEDIVEELLGEIQDEFDVEESRLIPIPNGGYIADARINVEELEDSLSVEFPEEREYESLGGFLMENAGEVPNVGWGFYFQGYQFVVSEADLNRVIKVQIFPTEPPSPPQELEEEREAEPT